MHEKDMKEHLLVELGIPYKPYAGLNSKFFFIGSCFSEHIAQKLSDLKFETTWNPFGILYNPLSIAHAVDYIVEKHRYTEEELYFSAGKFHSLDHHGSYQSASAKQLLSDISDKIISAENALKNANIIWITLGTSFVYYHLGKSQFVGNCHKIPNTEFDKILLSENEIVEQLRKLTSKIQMVNPNAKIGFTISPVKHLRDGIAENALSKARLLSALHAFLHQSGDEFDYFPAFEIVTEELRDYRFYAEDLAHPSAWTQNYIFDRLMKSRFDQHAFLYAEKYARYLRMENHRPQSSDNTELAAWVEKKASFLQEIKREFPDKIFPTQKPAQ